MMASDLPEMQGLQVRHEATGPTFSSMAALKRRVQSCTELGGQSVGRGQVCKVVSS